MLFDPPSMPAPPSPRSRHTSPSSTPGCGGRFAAMPGWYFGGRPFDRFGGFNLGGIQDSPPVQSRVASPSPSAGVSRSVPRQPSAPPPTRGGSSPQPPARPTRPAAPPRPLSPPQHAGGAPALGPP